MDERNGIKPATNSRFAKAGVSWFYDSEVLISNIVFILKFSARFPRLRKAPKRCASCVVKTLGSIEK